MRAFICAVLTFVALTSTAKTAPLSEADLKNLFAGIRQNRTTQADFQEERMIRLMKKPILSSGTIWFQPPNKFRREVKGNSPSVTVSDGRQLWIYYPNFKSAERYPLGKGSPLDSTVAAINSALNLENIENLRVARTDMLLPNGDRIVTTYSNQMRAPIPAYTFEFKPPPDTEVTTPLGQ